MKLRLEEGFNKRKGLIKGRRVQNVCLLTGLDLLVVPGRHDVPARKKVVCVQPPKVVGQPEVAASAGEHRIIYYHFKNTNSHFLIYINHFIRKWAQISQ